MRAEITSRSEQKIASRITPSDIDFKSMPYDERLTRLEASVTITKTNFIHPSSLRRSTRLYNSPQFSLFRATLKKKEQFPSFFQSLYIRPFSSPLLHPFRDTRAVITKSTFPVKIAECKQLGPFTDSYCGRIDGEHLETTHTSENQPPTPPIPARVDQARRGWRSTRGGEPCVSTTDVIHPH